jgi:hydroxymethylpyrimidine pyrophosphatase-like HAD family hydrolase
MNKIRRVILPLKLLVLDIDGVLSQGEGHPFDLSLLQRLAALNRQARTDKAIPAVTLNTGRPSPYVEAMMQAIDGWQPALYESGAGMYFPTTYQFQTTPLLSPDDKIRLQQLIAVLDKELVQTGKAYWQPGKTVCHTLFAIPPLTIADIKREAQAIAAQYSDTFTVTSAVIALNIHPAHINKASGLAWLAEITDIDYQAMGGVGDSDVDTEFMRLVGYAAAPANATDGVKAAAQYVSTQHTAAGLHDILNYWGI